MSILLGRGWPGPGEPLYTVEDTGAALEYQKYLDSLCNGCGSPLDETTDPANERAWEPDSLTCHKCAARDRGRQAFASSDGDTSGGDPAGVLFLAVPKITEVRR